MARPTLFTHPKFRRLVYLLGVPVPHALGYLELIWHTGYESGNAVLGGLQKGDLQLADMMRAVQVDATAFTNRLLEPLTAPLKEAGGRISQQLADNAEREWLLELRAPRLERCDSRAVGRRARLA